MTTDKNNTKIRVGIVGAGISGCAMALELSKLGYAVTIYEKDTLLTRRVNQFVSFNYTINFRGRKQLIKLGLWDMVEKLSVPLYGRHIHKQATIIKQEYCLEGNPILHAITREDLLGIFNIKLLEDKNIQVLDDCRISCISSNDEKVLIFRSLDGVTKTEEYDFIVAADGSNSFVRQQFDSFFRATVEKFDWNYIQINLPKDECINKNLDSPYINFWPFENFMGIGIPNFDSSFSVLHVFNPCEKKSFSLDVLFQQVKIYLNNVNLLVENDNFKIGKMLSVKAEQWFLDDKVILIGDAAHGIYPFLGQGMNIALDDVHLLTNLLKNNCRLDAFKKFQRSKKPDLDRLNKMSSKHFKSMYKSRFIKTNSCIRQFDLTLSKIFHQLWVDEYHALSNSDKKISVLHKQLVLQKILKFTPFYLIPFSIYFLIISLKKGAKIV